MIATNKHNMIIFARALLDDHYYYFDVIKAVSAFMEPAFAMVGSIRH